jgi:hypothetical protein
MEMQNLINSMPSGIGLKVKIMGILILVVSTGFVWMATDQSIASPTIRTMDFLWRLFVCRCVFQFDLLQ